MKPARASSSPAAEDHVSCNTLSAPSCLATRREHGRWDTARLPSPRQGKSRVRGRVQTKKLLSVNPHSNHCLSLAEVSETVQATPHGSNGKHTKSRLNVKSYLLDSTGKMNKDRIATMRKIVRDLHFPVSRTLFLRPVIDERIFREDAPHKKKCGTGRGRLAVSQGTFDSAVFQMQK
ncbi:hypothetical protein T265_00169 [Opisthorchis viverrini]|uniref:Uncharacterized protein n=1 Tax=Opisthorchis viverrini TaxID=6198 RepID=A0A075AK12_OPIVI|nr:hypothetical protein T265_00169 [Opisthorchis viverrini]KER34329.1 hypothetical protein T265_00169 [Opisthorchis viverrini]